MATGMSETIEKPIRRRTTWIGLLGVTALLVVACGGDDGDAATPAPAEVTDAPAAEVTDAPAAEVTDAPAAEVTDAPAVPTSVPVDPPENDASDDAAADTAAEEAAEAIAALDFGSGTASVTLDGETIEFSLGTSTDAEGNPQVGVCQELFGIIAANGHATDGRDIEFSAQIPPNDWETYTDGRYDAPSVALEIAEGNRKLVADAVRAEEFGYEGSAVTEFESDGTAASGSAMFVNEWAAEGDGRTPIAGTFEVACTN